ncbi:MAG: holo-ACP synthase [Bacteroidetes bacterium]|nr:MAG: holo-ACP synthase [Bacteroidota bacterium]
MVIGVGIDLIEVERVGRRVQRGEAFKRKVFTPAEIAYCEKQAHPGQHFAARFAAKEAFFKALGTGWSGDMQFYEVEVQHLPSGRPGLLLHGSCRQLAAQMGVTHIHLSLTHLAASAAAVVVLEGEAPPGKQ